MKGTIDYSNYLASEGAIAFNRSLGGTKAIQAYTDELLTWAQKMLAEAMGTEALPVPKSMEAPYMRCLGRNDKCYLLKLFSYCLFKL